MNVKALLNRNVPIQGRSHRAKVREKAKMFDAYSLIFFIVL